MRVRLSTIIKGLLTLMVAVVVTAVAILYSTDFNAYKDDIRSLVREATGRDLVIEGNFKPTLSLTPSLVVERVKFSNAPWGSQKDMARIGALRAELELLPAFFGEIRIKQVVLSGADILLETNAEGIGNWVMKPQEPKQKEQSPGSAPTIPTFDRVLIENSRIVWRDGRAGTRSTITIERLRAQARTLESPLGINLKGSYDGHPVALDGTIGSLAALTTGSALALNFSLHAGGAKVAVKGDIKRPLSGTGITVGLKVSGKNLATLNGLTGASLPSIGPYDLSATLSDQDRRWQFKGLKLSMGGSDLAGTLTIDPGVKPTGIKANLKSTLLREVDFRDRTVSKAVVKSQSKPEKSSGNTEDNRVFSDEVLPLDMPRDTNLKLTLRAKRIETSNKAVNEASLDLSLKDGVLVIRPFKAEYGKGQFVIRLMSKPASGPPELSFDFKMTKLDLAEAIKEAGSPGLLTGHMDARASLRGTGRSVRSIMAGLNGTIQVTMNGGRIDKKMLDLLDSEAFEILSPWSGGDKGIEIKCLVGRYGIRNGKLKSDATVFDTDRLLVVGEGGVNLASEEIDFSVTPTARDVSLLKLIVGLDVGGTLASPTVLPDPGAIARGAVGVAAGLVSGRIIGSVIGQIISGSSNDAKNSACLAALQAKATDVLPEKGATPAEQGKSPRKEGAKKVLKDIGEGIKAPLEGAGKIIEGVGDGLKELLGR